MLKLLLFACVCIVTYRLVRVLLLNAAGGSVKGQRPSAAERHNVVDADFVDVDVDVEGDTGGQADTCASGRESS